MAEWSTSALTLISVFVSFYILSVSTITYISTLSNVTVNPQNISEDIDSRLKRDAVPKYETDLWMKNITLNKCCGQNQIMNLQNRCESQEYKMFNPSDIIEKLEFFVVDDKFHNSNINASRINFAYNYYDPGVMNDALVVNWVINDSGVKTNYLFLQEDASLLELDHNRSKADKKFSTKAYCLDENNYYGSGLIAYINPCVENLCIRKCCPKHWYFNTIQQKCLEKSTYEYKPQFYFTTSYSEKEIPYYLFIGDAKCSLSDSRVKINANIGDPVYIQEDGYLLFVDSSRDQYYFYDNKSYCVDLFSNGIQSAYVNGFYCKKEANFMRPADVNIRQFADVFQQSSLEPVKFLEKITDIPTKKPGFGKKQGLERKSRGRKRPHRSEIFKPKPVSDIKNKEVNVKESQVAGQERIFGNTKFIACFLFAFVLF